METNDYVNAGIALLAIFVGIITGLVASKRSAWKKEGEQEYREQEQAKFNDKLIRQLDENVKATQEVYTNLHTLNARVEKIEEEKKELATTVSKLGNEVSRLRGMHDS